MNIRQVEKSDRNAWSKMRTELWPDTDDKHLSEIEDYFKGRSIDIVQVYVAEIESKLVGFLELNIRNYAEGSLSSRIAYVEAWYVDPAYRGKGYGKQLMHKAEQWAREKDFNELASDTEIDNLASIDIHKHLGFQETERIVCFLKQI